MVRLAIAAAAVAAIAATYVGGEQPVHPFDFFGFFTIQSNLLAAAVEAAAGLTLLRGRTAAGLLRGAATTYIVLTGIVYNTLLVGTGAVEVPWANQVLHVWVPLLVLLDWVLVGDRAPLPWRTLPAVVPYPLVWLVVVLIRGATDGWVPYPFLDPALGYGVVAAYAGGITALVLLIAAAVWAASRLRVLRPDAALRVGAASSRDTRG